MMKFNCQRGLPPIFTACNGRQLWSPTKAAKCALHSLRCLLPVPLYAPPYTCALPPPRSKHHLAHRVPGRAPCPSALLWCADARALTLTFLVPVPLCLQVHGAGMILEAWRKVLSVIGGPYKERWPDNEYRIIFLSTVFTYTERLTALTFIYGNIRDASLVYSALHPQLGVDAKDHEHALRFLADLKSGKYDQKYHYFDVLAGDWLFLDGTVNARRTPPSPLARLLLAWERECAHMHCMEKRWPTLAEQRAFLST